MNILKKTLSSLTMIGLGFAMVNSASAEDYPKTTHEKAQQLQQPLPETAAKRAPTQAELTKANPDLKIDASTKNLQKISLVNMKPGQKRRTKRNFIAKSRMIRV